MKRPMLCMAAPFVGGVLVAEWLGAPSPLPLALWLALTTAAAVLGLAWSRVRLAAAYLGLLAAGAASLTFTQSTLSPLDLRTLAAPEPVLATVRGHLLETPVHRIYTHQDHVTHRTQAEVEVSEVRLGRRAWQPAFGVIAVSTARTLDSEFYGGRAVTVEGVLSPPPGPAAPGGFDYQAYLARRGIYFQLRCGEPGDWTLDDASQPAPRPLADRFGTWAMRVLSRGLPVEDQALQLLWAMTLGWRTALTGEVSDPFMRSGTMHVFAISGLHVALIAGLLVSVLRVCGVPRPWCAWIIIPLLWLYTGVTGWQASAIRSTIMMSVIVAGWWLARPPDLLNSIAAAAFIILIWDPAQLFQAGFQLSFAVVLSLALLGPTLDRWRHRIFQFDPWIPDSLRPRWQRWLRRPLDYLTTSAAVSLAAWLGSLPLIAVYFNLITPISLLANLVVVPLSSGALACAFGSLLAGPVIPLAGELFNHSAWFLMSAMIRASQWAADVPLGNMYVGTPSVAAILAYYGAFAGLLTGAWHRPRLRWWCLGALVTLGSLAVAQGIHHHSSPRLTIVPVNGGAAFHLESPRPAECWLIDCGDDAAARSVLKPHLHRLGVNRIANVLLTHGDVHHTGGAAALRESFDIDHAWFSPVPFRSRAYRDARAVMEKAPSIARTLHSDQVLAPWTVLHPADHDRQPQADDNAVVLLGQFGDTRVLLLSDLGKPGQNLLLNRHPDLRADIVITGIPSQSEPLADALIETLEPRLIIVADAEYPATQRASAAVRDRLATHGIRALYTRDTGPIVLTFPGHGWTLQMTRPDTHPAPTPPARPPAGLAGE